MKQSDDNRASGTLTIVLLTLEVNSQVQARDLMMEDIAQLLDECLAGRGELLADDGPQVETDLSSPKRILH